ncbi:hypothetical protein [Nocardioides speluncae]|uniref:hypothetical protein n=1 Tax=Nocardioides speluncae TaxID=2670337 RepID=UPI000D68CD45|nr:hypothetical protein [Nocardioides speluncae]
MRAVAAWSIQSQQTARRNAMIAATDLAGRRAEIDEVEAFLENLETTIPHARRTTGGHPAHG